MSCTALLLSACHRNAGRLNDMSVQPGVCRHARRTAKQMVRQNEETPGRRGQHHHHVQHQCMRGNPKHCRLQSAAKGGVSSLTRYVKPSVRHPVHGTERCQSTCTTARPVDVTDQRGCMQTLSLSGRSALPEHAPPRAGHEQALGLHPAGACHWRWRLMTPR